MTILTERLRTAAERAFARWIVDEQTRARALWVFEQQVTLVVKNQGEEVLTDAALEQLAYAVRLWIDHQQFAVFRDEIDEATDVPDPD